MVRAFRLYLAERVFEAILAPWIEQDGRFNYMRVARWEGPLWRLVTERPAHLLEPRHAGWQDQFLEAADAVWNAAKRSKHEVRSYVNCIRG